MYIRRFDGALFIRADRDAEIDNLSYSCGLHGVSSALIRSWMKLNVKTLSQVTWRDGGGGDGRDSGKCRRKMGRRGG